MSETRYFASSPSAANRLDAMWGGSAWDKEGLSYSMSFDGETLELVTWGDRMPEFPQPYVELDLGSAGKWRGRATEPPEPVEGGMVRYRITMHPHADAPYATEDT